MQIDKGERDESSSLPSIKWKENIFLTVDNCVISLDSVEESKEFS
jgi:hypothetical protein